ncbi:MAG: hypothetical protein ACLGHN_15715, partial [Bacteriovoracia bacterium]
MWIILGVLFSLSAFALEPFENLKGVKILRVLPGNVVVMNRGLEDGILRNDHAKLSNDTAGYSSRALCLKVTPDLSYWKLYRIPHSEAFSLDYTYTITGLADREIPRSVARLRDEVQKVQDIEAADKPGSGPDPFQIKKDLPEKLTERDLIKAEGPERNQLFIEKTLNKDLLERDLQDYRISLYASPFTRQSINEGESMRYGFRGGNVGRKYRLLTQFEQQRTKLTDPLTKEEVSTNSTNAQVNFIIKDLTDSTSTLSLVNYRSQSFSKLGTPASHWQVGPIGFTWHIYESKTWEYMEFSYIPLYDLRKTDVINPDGSAGEVKTDGLRHGLRFAVKSKINERVAFENLLWVRPFQELSTWNIESGNLNLVNDLKFVFSL